MSRHLPLLRSHLPLLRSHFKQEERVHEAPKVDGVRDMSDVRAHRQGVTRAASTMPTLCPTRLMGSVGASAEMRASRSEIKLGTCNADDAGRDHWLEPR